MKTPSEKVQILEPKMAENRNRNKLLTTATLIERGLTQDECKAICTSSIIPIREKTFFRVIYETGLRPMEALYLQIEYFNRETGELVALRTKGKKINTSLRQSLSQGMFLYRLILLLC